MPFIPAPSFASAFARTQMALRMNQDAFGRLIGVSRRTISRWVGTIPGVTEQQIVTLVRTVHPKDAALARELAAHIGQTLESLRVVVPPPLPPPPAPPPPPPRPLPPIDLMVESIVCAAADALETKPAAVREVLSAAFGRAKRMGLTVDEVADALGPKAPSSAAVDAPAPKATGARGKPASKTA